jgi:hypothetical protein
MPFFSEAHPFLSAEILLPLLFFFYVQKGILKRKRREGQFLEVERSFETKENFLGLIRSGNCVNVVEMWDFWCLK